MAARTRVVLDLVGPYTLYGEPVIEACIEDGAHYVDLTGEIPFVRRMIDAAHERAEEAGVKIVNVSGFEALPADLCVAARRRDRARALERGARRPPTSTSTTDHAGRRDQALPTSISGGTLQSLAEMRRRRGRRRRSPTRRP